MKNYFKIILVAVSIFLTCQSHAAISPASLSILPPVQFPPEEYAITGVRASVLWGMHRNIYGLDIGLLGNITEQSFTGIAVSGIFNATEGTTHILGLQLAGLTNINTNQTSVYGVQATLGVNYNKAASKVVGLQLALLSNYSAFTDIYGAQVGLYNKAKDVYGFQIGLVNDADNLHGMQIGLVNFNRKGLLYVSPLINIGF